MRYRVGTRGSKLALAQTKQVIEKLKSAFPEDEFDVVIIKTTGDMDQKSRLDQIGSKVRSKRSVSCIFLSMTGISTTAFPLILGLMESSSEPAYPPRSSFMDTIILRSPFAFLLCLSVFETSPME